MSTYTLEYDGETQTLAEWGADDRGVLSLQNQGAGKLTLNFPGMMDADVPFAYKGKVILRKDETILFRGHAMEPKRSGDGPNESLTIQFVDAWWFLTVGTISQTIYDGAHTPSSRSGTITYGSYDIITDLTGLTVGLKLTSDGLSGVAQILSIDTGAGTITTDKPGLVSAAHTLVFQGGETASNLYALFASLNVGTGWNHRTVGDTLSAIITACDAHHGGGIMQFGACYGAAFALQPQPIDVKGSFATALQAALAYAPDAVPLCDYTTDPPTWSFYQRSAATVITQSFADETVMVDKEITARRELLVTGARFIYQYYLTDGAPATAIDQAGDETGPGVVQVEFEMHAPGQSPTQVPAVVEKQSITTQLVDVSDPAWWVQWAKLQLDPADVSIFPDTDVLELDPDAPENAGLSDAELADIGGCNRMVLSGAVPGWLNQEAHLKYVRASALLALKIWNNPADHDQGFKRVFRSIDLTFAASDLVSGEQTNTVVAATTEGGTFDPESPPSGLAAAFLAALNVLQYEGAHTLTADECAFDYAPGKVLNVSGGRSEWAAMKAQIQAVTHRLQSGTTSVTYGPAEHLAPQDWLQLARRMMVLKPALQLDARASGTTGSEGSGNVSHPQSSPRFGVAMRDNIQETKDVSSAGSITTKTVDGKMVLSDGTTTITLDAATKEISMSGGGKSITANLADLPAGADVKFRQYSYCDAGATKTFWAWGTVPA